MNRNDVTDGVLYRPKEVAALLKIGLPTLRTKRWRQKLTPIRYGDGRLFYPGERINALLDEMNWPKEKPRRALSQRELKARVEAATERALAAV